MGWGEFLRFQAISCKIISDRHGVGEEKREREKERKTEKMKPDSLGYYQSPLMSNETPCLLIAFVLYRKPCTWQYAPNARVSPRPSTYCAMCKFSGVITLHFLRETTVHFQQHPNKFSKYSKSISQHITSIILHFWHKKNAIACIKKLKIWFALFLKLSSIQV